MKVAALQTDIVWEDPQANFDRIRPWIKAAAASGVRLLALPEMYSTGFSMNTEVTAEPEGGPSTEFLTQQARAHRLWICGSLPEKPAGCDRPYNTLVLAGPNGEITRYRKIHPFTFAKEDEHYLAGNQFVTTRVDGLRCTLFVCYDLRFADEFWATARDTDVYVIVANWPERRRHHWTTLLRARAIENQAYVVGLNRVGQGNGLDYVGDSQIIDPWGEILVSAAREETLLFADVDPRVVAGAREKFPIFGDRRT